MTAETRPPWHGWYSTARWRALRRATFLRDKFACHMCGHVKGDTSQLVCDHVKRHGGAPALFWDPANLQTLCKSCHDGEKQRQEQATRSERGVWW